MKKWITDELALLGRIIHELTAVKTIAMVLISIGYFPNSEKFGFFGFICFSLFCLSYVGVRYAEKRLELLKKAKELV